MEPTYPQLLEMAEGLNDIYVFGSHPCIRIQKKHCCYNTTVPIAGGDKRRIQNAIDDGSIPLEVVAQAKRNVESEKPYCGFFNARLQECMIYAVRPIICVSAGGLFFANSPGLAAEQALSGGQMNLAVEETGSTMCRKCHKRFQAQNRGKLVDGQTIRAGALIMKHLERSTPMNEFIQNGLVEP